VRKTLLLGSLLILLAVSALAGTGRGDPLLGADAIPQTIAAISPTPTGRNHRLSVVDIWWRYCHGRVREEAFAPTGRRSWWSMTPLSARATCFCLTARRYPIVISWLRAWG
jgi:hypothetical protein